MTREFRLVQEDFIAENVIFGQIVPQKGPADPPVGKPKIRKPTEEVKEISI